MSQPFFYRMVETPNEATISIFIPGHKPLVAQSSHPNFEMIVQAAKEGSELVSRYFDLASPDSEIFTAEMIAAQSAARPTVMCPKCMAPILVSNDQANDSHLTCPFCGHEWNEFIVPDRIGAINSWKGLKVELVAGKAVVKSPAYGHQHWKPGEAVVAKHHGSHKHSDEDTPKEGCSCGIYSGKTRAHQIRLGYAKNSGTHHDYRVLCELALSGKVIVATNGFKAQYARITKFIVPDAIPEDEREELVLALQADWEILGVPVLVETIEAPINRAKWCPECGAPAPEDPKKFECEICESYLERG